MKLQCSINQLRTKQVQVTADFLGIDIELQHNDAKKLQKPDFLLKSLAGKIPALESKDGQIFETLAIQQYLSSFQPQLNLLGNNDFNKAQVIQWVLYLQNEQEVPLELLINLSQGLVPANDELKQKLKLDIEGTLVLLDKQLQLKTFLVDHQITLVDINLAVNIERLTELKEFDQKKFVNLQRHYSFVSQQQPFVTAQQKIQIVSTQAQQQALQNQQATEKQQQQTKSKDKKEDKKDSKKEVKKDEKQQSQQIEQKKETPKLAEGEVAPATNEDFGQIDIRVGKIVECWKHPESENLYCEKIDIGDGTIREIGSGLQKFVPIEQMSGLVLVLANLKPRKLAGFNSNGMVLCASSSDHTKVELMRPHPDCKVGERVTLEQYDKITQDFASVLNPKKKYLETVLPHLKTNDSLTATFNGNNLLTTQGIIKCQTLNNCKIA